MCCECKKAGDLGRFVFIVINLKKILQNLLFLCTLFLNNLHKILEDLTKILTKSYKFCFAFCTTFPLIRYN